MRHWNELSEPDQAYYRRFFERRCGLHDWRSGQPTCPVVRYQMAGYKNPRRAPLFFPEVLCGDPKNRVWYLGINPGQGHDEDSERYCPNVEESPPLDLPAYAERYLSWYEEQDEQRHEGDKVTAGVMAVELLRLGSNHGLARVTTKHKGFDRSVLAGLTVANVIHCKSPNWSCVPCSDEYVKRSLWSGGGCGEVTFDMILHWRPRVVVCMGGPVRDWLSHQSSLHSRLVFARLKGQTVDAHRISALALDSVDTVRLDDSSVCFMVCRHPSRWSIEHAARIASRLRELAPQ